MLMKCSLVTALLLIAIIAVPSQGRAADTNGKFAVRGIGSTKCSQMLSAIDSKDKTMSKDSIILYSSWLNGYVSHLNRSEKSTYDIVPLSDTTQLLAVVVNQCRNNAGSLVESITSAVITALSKAKVSAESPLVDLTVGDQKGSFRKATLIALQSRLIALGHLKGKADGEFGSGSQQALRALQKTEKLKETGFPDADTIMRALLK